MNKTSRGTGGAGQANGQNTEMFQARFGRLFGPAGDSTGIWPGAEVDAALGSRSKSHAGTGAVPYTR